MERFPRRAKELRSVWDHLHKQDIYKSMGLGRMHPRLLGGLANIIAEAHCNIFDRSWSLGGVPADWKRANITHIYKNEVGGKRFGKLQMSQPHLSTLKNYGVDSPGSYFWA